MKKRLISLLLVVCLLLSCLPVGALAATPEELYAQMLDLGLVDEDGTLIENNRFTVEGGTTLSSLEELRLWLHELDEGDFDCKVTVDATGKVATAEQLMQVLNIEYQIAEVAEQLNLLASGAVSTQAASVNTAAHNWNLLVGADIGSESIMILSVKPYASGTYAAPQDLQVEVGLFADFLTSSSGLGDITNRDTSFGYCGDIPTNQFGTFTIQSGGKGLYFSINLEKLRAYAASNIDLWDGNTYLLFQARVKSGMNTVSKSVVISLAPESSTSNIISYINKKGILSAYKNGVTVALAPESDASEGKPYSYKLTTGTASYNGKSYITFEIPQLYDRKRGLQWQDAYYKAIQAGVGDSEPKAVINSVYLLTEYNEAGAAKAPNIYGVTKSSDNGSITKFQNMGSADMRTDRGKTAGNELSTIAGFNKADAGQWNTSDAGTIDGLNKKIYDGDKEVIAFFDLYLPLDTSVGKTLTYPTTWYLESDWNTQNKSVEQMLVFCGLSSINQSGKDVYELEANLYLADTTAPTVKSVEVAASAGTTFHPGDVVPIVVTFSEPVYGDYQLVYQHGGETKTLSNCTSTKENAAYNRTGSVCSNTRTFYYTVQDTDNGALSILGVMGDSQTAKDVLGNAFQQTEPLSGSYYQKFTASLNCLGGMRPQDSIGTMTATVAAVEEGQIANPNNYTVTISLSDDTAFKQAWTRLPRLLQAWKPALSWTAIRPIEDLEYTVHAEFSGSSTAEVKDTIYLDYPDVGISRLTLTKEQDGERVLLAALYNQSAAALSRSDRRVVLGVYSDPSCEMPVDGKYFADGIANQAYERILTGDTLAAIDKAGSAQQMVFCMETYVEDAGLTEIPDDGITLYVKASIEQLVDEQWIALPEADTMNNQKHITLESLLVQASGQPPGNPECGRFQPELRGDCEADYCLLQERCTGGTPLRRSGLS